MIKSVLSRIFYIAFLTTISSSCLFVIHVKDISLAEHLYNGWVHWYYKPTSNNNLPQYLHLPIATSVNSYNDSSNNLATFPTHIYYHNFLSKEEVTKIIAFAETIPAMKADTDDPNKANLNSLRKSSIRWLPRNAETLWLYQKFDNLMRECNTDNYHFEIAGMRSMLQYTEYYEPDGFYNWHQDLGEKSLTRKLSLVAQLSDPKDYTGGELQVKYCKDEYSIPKNLGAAVIFPSYMLHRVQHVTSGKRISLVAWYDGNSPFK